MVLATFTQQSAMAGAMDEVKLFLFRRKNMKKTNSEGGGGGIDELSYMKKQALLKPHHAKVFIRSYWSSNEFCFLTAPIGVPDLRPQ